MDTQTHKTVLHVSNKQIVLFGVVLGFTLAFFFTLFQQWPDVKRGFIDGFTYVSSGK